MIKTKQTKYLLIIGMVLLLTSLASADLGIYQQGDNVSVRGNINATAVNVTIYYPNSSVAVNNQPMTRFSGDIWNYNFSSTDNLGDYIYDYCDEDGENCIENKFEVNLTGFELTPARAIVYAIFFVLLIALFIMTIFGIAALPSSNATDPEGNIISISNLKYLRNVLWMFEWVLVIGILYISSNIAFAYLGEELFAQALFTLFVICMSFSPVIVVLWFIWIFVQIFQDKKIRALYDRGFIPKTNL